MYVKSTVFNVLQSNVAEALYIIRVFACVLWMLLLMANARRFASLIDGMLTSRSCSLQLRYTRWTVKTLERCNPWPHVANRRISISQLLSLGRHSHYHISRLRRSQPRSHYDVICYWAGHAQRDGRTYVRADTLPRLIYKDGPDGRVLFITLLSSDRCKQFLRCFARHAFHTYSCIVRRDSAVT